MDIRLIATDLDGTLLDGLGRIPPYTERTIRDCLARGVAFAIVSGRCHESARMPASDYGLDLILASANGARIDRTPDGPTIYERRMTGEECEAVYGILKDCPGNILIYTRGRVFCRQRPSEFGAPYIRMYGGIGHRCKWIYDDVEWMEREGLKDAHKFEIYEPNPALLAEYAAKFRALGFAVTSSSSGDIEIQPADSTKGAAVRHIAEAMGLCADQVMAFGDYTNDLSMLQYAGIGVAMANGQREMIDSADLVAPANTEEGEARTIRRIVFGEDDMWPAIQDE